MTNDEYILAEIRPFIVEKLDVEPDEVTMGADLREYLGARSLDMVEGCTEVERKFDISFLPDGNENDFYEENAYIVEHIRTVGDLVRLIKRKLDAKESSPMVLFFMARGGKSRPIKRRKPVDKFVMPQNPMMLNPGKKR